MAGETTVYVCSRCASKLFAVGDSVRLSGSGNSESRRVAALGPADSGKIVLDSPLASGYPVGSSVFNQASNNITTPCPPECPQDECDCDRGAFYKAVQQATEEEFVEIQNESAYQAQSWMRKLRAVSQSHIRQGDKVLAQVGQRQINITLGAAVRQRQAELDAVDQMNQSIEEARLRMMPIAVNNSVREWAVKHSKNLAAGMLDPVLEGAIQDMKHVNDVRERASQNLQRAQLLEGNLTTLSEAIVQLKPVVSSWISGFLVNYSSEVSMTVQQLITMNNDSEQLAQLVYQTAFEAKDMARNELNGAKAAEASAMEALARARSNTERIARLKTRMEKLMQGQQATQPTVDE